MKTVSKFLIGLVCAFGSLAHAQSYVGGSVWVQSPNASVYIQSNNGYRPNHYYHHRPHSVYVPPVVHHHYHQNSVMPCDGCYVPPRVVIQRHQRMMNPDGYYPRNHRHYHTPYEPIR